MFEERLGSPRGSSPAVEAIEAPAAAQVKHGRNSIEWVRLTAGHAGPGGLAAKA